MKTNEPSNYGEQKSARWAQHSNDNDNNNNNINTNSSCRSYLADEATMD